MSRNRPAVQNRTTEFLTIGGIGLLIIIIFIVALLASGDKNNSSSGGLALGSTAPTFSLNSNQGNISLDNYKDKPVLLYFNEGVGCQPCWQQIVTLEKDSRFTNLDIPILTIVTDQLSTWQPILDNNPIKSPILSDSSSQVSRSYGMLNMKSSMHGGVKPGHTFVLLDKNHTIQWIGDYPTMNASVDEIVKTIKEKL